QGECKGAYLSWSPIPRALMARACSTSSQTPWERESLCAFAHLSTAAISAGGTQPLSRTPGHVVGRPLVSWVWRKASRTECPAFSLSAMESPRHFAHWERRTATPPGGPSGGVLELAPLGSRFSLPAGARP